MNAPTTDMTNDELKREIARLKREMNAIVLAHYYQDDDIQSVADALGDSLALARKAAKTDAEVIVFCGVHFMAETAKLLNPDKLVLLPDLDAGCALADCCPAEEFRRFLDKYDNPFVITYVNSSAQVKALSDVICTSGNVLKIVQAAPKDRTIVFAPDRNLGRFAMERTGREMVLWPGGCTIHETFDASSLEKLAAAHPDALVLAHPECPEDILRKAGFIGSTKAMLDHVKGSDRNEFIVVTEPGILREMRLAAPGKTFLSVDDSDGRPHVCGHMRLNTLEKLYLCMRDRNPQVDVPAAIRDRALTPLKRMLEWC